MLQRRMFHALVCLPALGCALAASAVAQSATAPIDALAAAVGNLGYETKMAATGKSFTIAIRSSYNFTINFSYSNDGTLVWMSANVATYTQEQLGQLNTMRLLEVSDPGPGYFALAKGAETDTLYAQRSLPAQGATPVLLRATIENLTLLITNNDTVWNKNLWK